jgi:VWFA-related protein
MESKLPICRSSLAELVNELNPTDEISLSAFSDEAFLLRPPTTEHASVVQALSLLHAYGRTSLSKALIAGIQLLTSGCASRRAFILVTDRVDEESSARFGQVAAMAHKNRVTIYSIGVGNPNTHVSSLFGSMYGDMEALDTKTLTALTNSTGGKLFIAKLDKKALNEAVSTIAGEIGNRYAIGFSGDGSSNQVRVEAPTAPNVIVKIEEK